MKFNLRHLLFATFLVALQLGFRSSWLSIRVPAHAAVAPLSLASLVAVHVGWTHRHILRSGLLAGVTALISSFAIAAEVMLKTNTTDFVTADQTAVLPNLLAIGAISCLAFVMGAGLARVAGLLHSLMKKRDYSRLSWFAVTIALFFLLIAYRSGMPSVSVAKLDRINVAMSRQQVEDLLGRPNPLPDLRRKNEAFWDTYTHFGRKYTSLHVLYDNEGNVQRLTTDGFWTRQPWLYW